jgi:RNA recognition motif-containing protein
MGTRNDRLYVGNLSWDTTEQDLGRALGQNGRTVRKVDLKTDPRTGRSRGFAFADLASVEEAHAAIDELHGSVLGGRTIKVCAAKEQSRRTGGYGRGDKGGYDEGYGDQRGFGDRRRGGRR